MICNTTELLLYINFFTLLNQILIENSGEEKTLKEDCVGLSKEVNPFVVIVSR